MMFSDINIENNIPSVPAGLIKIEDDFIDELKRYNKNSKFNTLNKEEYRKRINKLYSSIGMVLPIDNEINNVIYFDDYNEVGLVLNKKDVSLKQIWTEYRLLYNEKKNCEDKIMENSFVLDNFDELFDRISKKVDGIDNYIKELNEMKKENDTKLFALKSSIDSFEEEKIQFENYRRNEMLKLDNKEKELNEKLEKINKLMSVFENKINQFVDENKDTKL